MSDAETRGDGHGRQHVGGIEVPDNDPIADVGPRSLTHEPQVEALLGGKAAFGRHHQAGAVQQRKKTNNQLHRNNPAAVITACAMSTTRLLSVIAALRSSV